ncbi:uncharacterized protein G2W53_007172 [Senna tora]|uniref:Uncharacterized protein n=1 Tax=Senna tora TaxID=362788 RepID=A0A834X6A0_9FABA|nr:uncharacterized protein G2W53_007172 [Senna tora]
MVFHQREEKSRRDKEVRDAVTFVERCFERDLGKESGEESIGRHGRFWWCWLCCNHRKNRSGSQRSGYIRRREARHNCGGGRREGSHYGDIFKPGDGHEGLHGGQEGGFRFDKKLGISKRCIGRWKSRRRVTYERCSRQLQRRGSPEHQNEDRGLKKNALEEKRMMKRLAEENPI